MILSGFLWWILKCVFWLTTFPMMLPYLPASWGKYKELNVAHICLFLFLHGEDIRLLLNVIADI